MRATAIPNDLIYAIEDKVHQSLPRYDAFAANPGEDGLARRGPRFWASSSARAGMLAAVRARMAPAAAKLRLPVSGNMVRSPFEFRLLKATLS